MRARREGEEGRKVDVRAAGNFWVVSYRIGGEVGCAEGQAGFFNIKISNLCLMAVDERCLFI